MANVADPGIQSAYDDVRNDKSDVDWLLLDYQTDRSDVLKLTASGTDGLTGLKSNLKDGTASFAYAKITYANDVESKRSKFVFIVWMGPGVKVMRKAKLSVHAADVKQVLRQFSIEVPASSLDDLDEDSIVARLRKAGGADYGSGRA